jgi:hypothetical protein
MKKGDVVPFKKPIDEKAVAEQKVRERAAAKRPTEDTVNKPTDYKYLDQKGWWARDKGVSEAGALVRDWKLLPGTKEMDQSYGGGPYHIHRKIIEALLRQKPPGLPKSESSEKKTWSLPLAKAGQKIGISPSALKQQKPAAQPAKSPLVQQAAPTHVAGLPIPKELNEHKGIVPRDHPHREIAAKFVGDVWKRNRNEGQRLSEKYLGVGPSGKAAHTPTATPYTTMKSEDDKKTGLISIMPRITSGPTSMQVTRQTLSEPMKQTDPTRVIVKKDGDGSHLDTIKKIVDALLAKK